MNYSGGGTDFSNKQEVARLKAWLREMVEKAKQIQREDLQQTGVKLLLVIHLAPVRHVLESERQELAHEGQDADPNPQG